MDPPTISVYQSPVLGLSSLLLIFWNFRRSRGHRVCVVASARNLALTSYFVFTRFGLMPFELTF
jgi:hypothetical protein